MELRQEKLLEGLAYPFSSLRRSVFTLASTCLVFFLMVLSARPVYSYQMVKGSPELFFTAVEELFLYNSPGILSMFLTVSYSVLAGVAIVNTYSRLKAQGTGLKSLSGIAPGFLVSGCMGCGAGLLGFLGLTGAFALLPFNGNLVTIAGITLLLYYIVRTGDPETCSL